jgi:DNA-binding NarL/FixJ family response regulator
VERQASVVPIDGAAKTAPKNLGLVWVDCFQPVAAEGLARILETVAQVHVSRKPPETSPAFVVLGADDTAGLLKNLRRKRELYPDSPIVVFNWRLDLALAQTALRAGARGCINGDMQPKQILRALSVVAEGQIAAPRQLLEYMITTDKPVDLDILSSRQKEILELVGEGLSNAAIAERLFLSESTVKQHLRSAFKVLGVSNRTEAARLVLNK